MADEADLAERAERIHTDTAIAHVIKQAAQIPVGEPGDCLYCGEESKRLVRGACAPCRDRRGLP